MSFLERLFGGHHGGGHRGGGHHGGHHGSYGGGGAYGNGAPPAALATAGIGCPSCRTLNAPGARFCQQCGNSLLPAACTQCATPLPVGGKFCAQCGKAAA